MFSRQLIWDILSFPELSESQICLMDIDGKRLDIATQFAKKMVKDKRWGAKIERTLDRQKALEGADMEG